MGKGNRSRTGRADKLRRRAARAAKRQHDRGGHRHVDLDLDLVSVSPVPAGLDLAGWHYLGPGDDFDDVEDLDFTGPDEALLATSGCPVAETCAGCGDVSGLRPVVAAFSRPGGYDVACTTLCHACDGRSFLQLLGPAALEAAFHRHASHARPASPATAEHA